MAFTIRSSAFKLALIVATLSASGWAPFAPQGVLAQPQIRKRVGRFGDLEHATNSKDGSANNVDTNDEDDEDNAAADAADQANNDDEDDEEMFVMPRRRYAKSGKGGDSNINKLLHFPCVDFEHPEVQAAKDMPDTDALCLTNSCDDGCCRYHSSGLFCDTSFRFPYAACVCNANTDREANITIPIDFTIDPTLAPSTVPPTTPTPIVGSDTPDTDICLEGSFFQDETTHNCDQASACQGVTIGGRVTCCLRVFCFCETFDDFDNECVPFA
eukprot:CAMPEP_0198113960 /NCGR_PEP_ID=MMETSP1442-20131203/5489_1 /TAXON_ID= /ORGANISM="Craspedostauros australis, Strain CCMP3328" /LENGTH=270 /DNA_ID=CAMNT_0043771169 /DNA_START=805 /DNA_END=1617 /DNA_ORIENTATION=+